MKFLVMYESSALGDKLRTLWTDESAGGILVKVLHARHSEDDIQRFAKQYINNIEKKVPKTIIEFDVE